MIARFWNSKWWSACGIGLLSFAAGSLLTAVFARPVAVRADSNRLFELRVYHDVPGKVPVMEARFREKTSKILARHNLNVVGYWVTTDDSASENSFIFLLAHNNREEGKKNWDAVFSDPEFQEIKKAEQTEKTLEKAEVIYMRPTDFSPMK